MKKFYNLGAWFYSVVYSLGICLWHSSEQATYVAAARVWLWMFHISEKGGPAGTVTNRVGSGSCNANLMSWRAVIPLWYYLSSEGVILSGITW